MGVLLLTAVTRLRLLSIPLERDEGAFATIGRALWQGGQLYTTVFDNKPPLLYGVYSLFTGLFGYSAGGVHLGLLLFHFGAAYFLYLWVKELIGREAAWLSAAFFSLFALLPAFFGFAAHATQLLLLPALAGLWLLGRASLRWRSAALAGFFLGISFLIKQQAVGLVAGGLIWFVFQHRPAESLGWKTMVGQALGLLLGCLAPLAAILGWFAAQGRLDDLLHWTLELPAQLVAAGSSNADVFYAYVLPRLHGLEPALVLILTGVFFVFARKEWRSRAWPFVLLLLLTLATTCLGAAFYPHYFVTTLPFAAVLCALGVLGLYEQRKTGGRWLAPLLAMLVAGFPIALQSAYFFNPDFRRIHRDCYGLNPFPEMMDIGRTLQGQAAQGELLILGSEPEAFVAAGQVSPTGYPFMLDARMPGSKDFQQATRDYLLNKRPRFVIFVPALSSWYPGYKESPFVAELQTFLRNNYFLFGAAQIDQQSSKLLWNDEARKPPADPSKIGALIFRRKA